MRKFLCARLLDDVMPLLAPELNCSLQSTCEFTATVVDTQVGMEGRAAPWKVTHSIYSMFLLNVAETVAKQAF